MRDSSDSKSASGKYAAPQAVSLRDSETGVGANCESGSTARGHCVNGSLADANECQTGANVHGQERYGLGQPGLGEE